MVRLILCLLLWVWPFLSPTIAQSYPRDQLVGRWIGIHTEWDIDAHCPLPAYLDFCSDNTWHLGLIDGSSSPRTGTWASEGPVLRLDTTHYAPELVSMTGDFLRIGRVQPMTFRRHQNVSLKRETVWEQLAGQVWQSDSLQFLIAIDGRVALRNRRTGTQTLHYADLMQLEESAFLIIRGNKHSREGGIHAFWQVVGNDVGNIRLQGNSSTTETICWMRALGNSEPLQATVFQPCKACFEQISASTILGMEDSNRRKAIAIFQQLYTPIESPGQSGVIFVNFVQNCAGERGQIEIQELDTAYKSRPFDSRITNQIRTIIQGALPITLLGTGEKKIDQIFSFTFRLVDGRLTDVF